jgi:hypothetical protein
MTLFSEKVSIKDLSMFLDSVLGNARPRPGLLLVTEFCIGSSHFVLKSFSFEAVNAKITTDDDDHRVPENETCEYCILGKYL